MYSMIMITFTINIPPFCWHIYTLHTDPVGYICISFQSSLHIVRYVYAPQLTTAP